MTDDYYLDDYDDNTNEWVVVFRECSKCGNKYPQQYLYLEQDGTHICMDCDQAERGVQ